MSNRESLQSWQKLQQHSQTMKNKHMNELFTDNEQRFKDFSIQLPSMLLDYSKNLLTEQTLSLLFDLARDCLVESWRDKMFVGNRINKTEDRAVLHTLLRDRRPTPFIVAGKNVKDSVRAALKQMQVFTDKVRQGKWQGYSGKRITDIVNIGVGGSNLGPQMVTEALKQYSDNSVKVHYVSNVDGTQIANVLRPLNPESVLFIISSKK